MSTLSDLALRREIRRAIAETLQSDDSRHLSLPIKKAAAIAMARAHVSSDNWSDVVHKICQEGLRQRLVLQFR